MFPVQLLSSGQSATFKVKKICENYRSGSSSSLIIGHQACVFYCVFSFKFLPTLIDCVFLCTLSSVETHTAEGICWP